MSDQSLPSSSSFAVQFNGQAIDVPAGTTIRQLLEQAAIRSKLVAVEVNLEIVPNTEHASRTVQEGDVIEAVTLVGGG